MLKHSTNTVKKNFFIRCQNNYLWYSSLQMKNLNHNDVKWFAHISRQSQDSIHYVLLF